ncbi:hypothetical protein C9374_001456 [Naegleria lovaniensis]|uniref:C3H1-type domain-containing protein n=1 Tax=Naegleria lovaniensis TaxID=51637 RepID=A0AA88GS39_NAELO|nr:uncharacterized protein C9374_001456 [Naegleria lovaniensis]KAG2387862.1 hypothetical protein C9374_001456 [Naegleria lovaniensis]
MSSSFNSSIFNLNKNIHDDDEKNDHFLDDEHKVFMTSSLPMYRSFYEKAPCQFYYGNKSKSQQQDHQGFRKTSTTAPNNQCKFGSRCSYSHSAICKHYKLDYFHQDNNPHRNPEIKNQTAITKCGCTFGDKCKYIHLDFAETKSRRELKIVAESATEYSSKASEVNWFIRKENPLTQNNIKAFISMVGLKPGTKIEEVESSTPQSFIDIIDMSLNRDYTLFVLKDGTVWTTKNPSLLYGAHGGKIHGRLSTEMDWDEWKKYDKQKIMPIDQLERVPFDNSLLTQDHNVRKCWTSGSIFAGTFNYFMTHNGQLYSQGVNSWGQLGKGIDKSDSFIPRPVLLEDLEDGERPIDVALGHDHAVVLTSTANVYTIGLNQSGQCGTGGSNKDFHVIFQKVKIAFEHKDDHVIQIACGEDFTICLTRHGDCYGSGRNTCGRMGISTQRNVEDEHGNIFNFTKIDIPLQANDKIVNITCGTSNSCFLSEQGRVYMCGKNHHSQLSKMGGLKAVTTPTLVPLKHAVKKVFCSQESITFFVTEYNEIYAVGSNDYDIIRPMSSKNMSFNVGKPFNVTSTFMPDPFINRYEVVQILAYNMFVMVHLKRNNRNANAMRRKLFNKTRRHLHLSDCTIMTED